VNYIKKPQKYYINNKIDQLKCFCLTVQYQTIKEAEKHDIYSQSTISMQIASLEYDLQTKLLQSVQKKLKLTQKGEEFYVKAQKILTKLTKFYLPSVSNLDLIKKPTHNYKKNKLEQIDGFCLVAENQNIEKVAIKTDMSSTTICMQIASLEYDLQTKLFFKPQKNQFILTKNGKYYYKFGREIFNDIAKFYGKPKMKIKNLFFLAINQQTKHFYFKLIKKIKKMVIEIKAKHIAIIIFSIIITSTISWFCWANYTNYFFDRKINSISNKLLKEVIINKPYRISADNFCSSFDSVQVNIDMFDLVFKLLQEKKYQDLTVASVAFAEHPMNSFRMTGDDNIDKVFNDEKIIACHHEQSYNAFKQIFHLSNKIFDIDKNFRTYNLHHASLDDCLHCNYLLENINKHPNQLFLIKAEKMQGIPNVRFWTIKYGNYYYLLYVSNIKANHLLNVGETKEIYIIWEKLTKQQLKEYDNGSYWKLITDYNIKID
jgi:hypothetical protein